MKWNWQRKSWPNFTWNAEEISALEAEFLHNSGVLFGSAKHADLVDKNHLIAEILTSEAVKTSEIEGEILVRSSVQSSVRKYFGLPSARSVVRPSEAGIAELTLDLYKNFAKPLSSSALYRWHEMIMRGRKDLKNIGAYRRHAEPMQVISGALHKPKIHFEAPASKLVEKEMKHFLQWFEASAPAQKNALPALTRAGIAHLYFVSIHPFEDGNGRIARALSDKVLSQALGRPSLVSLAQVIQKKRSAYYKALQENNKDLDITAWLIYFAKTILAGQKLTQRNMDFLIFKTALYERLRGDLNSRQEKILEKLFAAGVDGFVGGLSADNYIRITKASRATATRDLQELVAFGALSKTGALKTTRYQLAFF